MKTTNKTGELEPLLPGAFNLIFYSLSDFMKGEAFTEGLTLWRWPWLRLGVTDSVGRENSWKWDSRFSALWILVFVQVPHYRIRAVLCALSSLMEKHVSREQCELMTSCQQCRGRCSSISRAVPLFGFFASTNHEETLAKPFTIVFPTSVVKVLGITKARHLSQKEKISSTDNNTVSIEIPGSNFLIIWAFSLLELGQSCLKPSKHYWSWAWGNGSMGEAFATQPGPEFKSPKPHKKLDTIKCIWNPRIPMSSWGCRQENHLGSPSASLP